MFPAPAVVRRRPAAAPFSEAVAEEYRAEAPGTAVSVGTSGTGGGFEKLCRGEIDVAGASRPIADEERAACEAAGVTVVELTVGLDGLAVVTSAGTDFVDCLSLDQLAGIFQEGGATRWDQVAPELPSEPIAVFAPGTDDLPCGRLVEHGTTSTVFSGPDDPRTLDYVTGRFG